MKEIALTKGNYTLVDDGDYKYLKQWKWHTVEARKGVCYAATHGYKPSGKKGTVFMHRLLLNPAPSFEIDHINRNGLDNRRTNLRIVTHAQNQQNRRAFGGASKYKGVSISKKTDKKYAAFIKKGFKATCKRFNTELEAALAYDVMARERNGDYAYLNFPNIYLPDIESVTPYVEALSPDFRASLGGGE